MSGILAYLVAFLLYALIGWHFWRTRWNAPAKLSGGETTAAGWERYAILVPLTLHGYTLYDSIFAGAGLNFGVGSAVSSIVWLTATIYWVSGFFLSPGRVANTRCAGGSCGGTASACVSLPATARKYGIACIQSAHLDRDAGL